MKAFVLRLYNGFGKTKAAILMAVLALYMVLAIYGGGSALELLRFALAVAAYLLLPGLVATEIMNSNKMLPGFRPLLVLLYGTGIFAALYCVAMRFHQLVALQLLPVLALLAYGVWRALAHKTNRLPALPQKLLRPEPHQWLLLLLFAALLLFYTFYGVVKNARPLAVGNTLLNQDLLWNVGNANSFKLAFPPIDIRYTGVRLHYHYLTELLAGALSLVSGVSSYNILAFYLQPYLLAALVLCLYRFGLLVFRQNRFKAVLFSYSMFLFSCASLWKILPNGLSVFWNSNITHLVTNINSQTTAIVYLCIFLGLFVHASRQQYKVSPLYSLTMLAAFFMLTFAKGPLAVLVAASMGITLVIGLLQKQTGWRGLLFGAAAIGLFAFVYVTMFQSGANESMLLTPVGTLEGGYFGNIIKRIWNENYYLWLAAIPVLWLLQSFLMAPAQFPLYLRGLFRDIRHFPSLPPERLLFNGVVVGGLAAYFLFLHPSLSQVYFLLAALFFLNLLAVDATDYLRRPKAVQAAGGKGTAQKLGVALVAVCAAVGVATTGFLYIHYVGSGARQLARNLGIVEKYPYDTVVTPDDEAAMLWLRGNSPADAMFATNRIHTGARKEGISNLYSAFCERQGFMEGFQYAKTNMGVSEEDIIRRLEVNEALFSEATLPEEILRLCRENGISYLIYSAQMDGSDSQLEVFERVYDSPSVRIYKVPG